MDEVQDNKPKAPISVKLTAFEEETIIPELRRYFSESRSGVVHKALFMLYQYCQQDAANEQRSLK